MVFNFLFIISLRLLFGFAAAARDCGPPDGVQVSITASSVASFNLLKLTKTERQLELNWFNVSPRDGDWVGLFSNDPSIDKSSPLVNISPSDHPLNYYRSSIQLPRFDFQISNLTNQCMGFWVAYVRSDVILAQNCARIQPQWMWESRDTIGGFTLSEIMIPGTHNSGSYDHYNGIMSENVLVRYKSCQDEDIFNQFVYGIRSFDLRIGSYPKKTDEFWVNHDKIKMYPFKTIMADLKKVVKNTKEIIVLDFHRFPVGFTNASTHDRFISYLIDELGEWMVPRSFTRDVKLSQLWARDKRVVVMYSDSIYYNYDLLWSGLAQKWGNTMELDQLKSFLAQFTNGPNWYMWAAMAELTPTAWTVFSKPRKGIRYFADKANRHVTQWFRDEWWASGNIVATDYFHGNDMVEVAIKSNQRRKSCNDSKMRVHSPNELL